MSEKLLQQLEFLPEDFVALIIIPRKDHEQLHMDIINLLINKMKSKGAYITLNRSYHDFIKTLQTRKMNYQNLFFIDCVTNRKSKAEDCVFLQSSPSLTSIGTALEPVYKSKDLSFILLDSLDALSLYHDQKMVLRFARSLVERIKENNKKGIILGLQGVVDEKVIDELSVVCDTVIDLSE